MLLIGSKALQYYIPDLKRVTHDYDVLMKDEEYIAFLYKNEKKIIKENTSSVLFEIDSHIVEVKPQSKWEPTDVALYAHEFNHIKKCITPFGECTVAEIAFLYDMKRATVQCIDEPKHRHDLKLMQTHFGFSDFETEFYKNRLEEAKTRTLKSRKVKKDFFHQYHIPEYVYHDELHEIIADLLDVKLPTYQRITNGDVAIAEELFNKLTHQQKVLLMVEESLVLALERWFIPQMVENGINHYLVDNFYDNNEGLPTYKILKHVNITGLKGEAEYIVAFGRENFFEIEQEWQKAKSLIRKKGGFPKSFFLELFRLRNEYKKGVQIDKGK